VAPKASNLGRHQLLGHHRVERGAQVERHDPHNVASAVVHDRFGQNPYWLPGRLLTCARWSSRSFLTVVSRILLIAERMETGQ
jgi:hypothetical protein